MSAILEPTPEMGPWRVEMRSRSAYLRGGHLRAHRLTEEIPAAGGFLNADGFAIRVADTVALLAALDQIIDHPAYTGATGVTGWDSYEQRDGWLSLHANSSGVGVYAYGLDVAGSEWSPASEIELVYDDLHLVRSLLAHLVEVENERWFLSERVGTWPAPEK